jgi:hypothetical protein
MKLDELSTKQAYEFAFVMQLIRCKAAQAQPPRRLPFAESIGYKMRLKLSVALPGSATG